jgi:hypothetical protein
MAYDIAAIPQNLLMKALDKKDLQVGYKDIGDSKYNPLSYIDQMADITKETSKKLSQSTKFDTGIIDTLRSGDMLKAGEQISYAIAENLPQYLFIAASVLTGNPNAGLALLSSSAAGGKYNEIKDDEELSTYQKYINSSTTGLNEFLFERIGTLPLMQSMMKSPQARAVLQKGLTSGIGKIFGNFIKEGASESATEISNNIIDIITGVKNEKGEAPGIFDNALDAGLIGGIMGTGIGFADQLQQYKSDQQVNQAEQITRDILLNRQPNEFKMLQFDTTKPPSPVFEMNQLSAPEAIELLTQGRQTPDEPIIMQSGEALGPPVIHLYPESQTYINTDTGELFVYADDENEITLYDDPAMNMAAEQRAKEEGMTIPSKQAQELMKNLPPIEDENIASQQIQEPIETIEKPQETINTEKFGELKIIDESDTATVLVENQKGTRFPIGRKALDDMIIPMENEPEVTVNPEPSQDSKYISKFRYYLTQRPPGPGAIPKNAVNVVAYDDKSNGTWGYVEYDNPLTEQEKNNYELTDEFDIAGDIYFNELNIIKQKIKDKTNFKIQKNEKEFVLVTPSAKEKGQYQATYFRDNQPTGDSQKANMEEIAEALYDFGYYDNINKIEEINLKKAEPAVVEQPKVELWQMTKDEYNNTLDKILEKYPERENTKDVAKLEFRIKMFEGQNRNKTDKNTIQQKIDELKTELGEINKANDNKKLEFAKIVQKDYPNMKFNITTDGKEIIITHAGDHKSIIEKAIAEGKEISEEIMKDYPDLMKPTSESIVEPTKPAQIQEQVNEGISLPEEVNQPVEQAPVISENPLEDFISWARTDEATDISPRASYVAIDIKDNRFNNTVEDIKKGIATVEEIKQVLDKALEKNAIGPAAYKANYDMIKDIKPINSIEKLNKGDRIKYSQGEDSETFEGNIIQVNPTGEGKYRYKVKTDNGQTVIAYNYKGELELVSKTEQDKFVGLQKPDDMTIGEYVQKLDYTRENNKSLSSGEAIKYKIKADLLRRKLAKATPSTMADTGGYALADKESTYQYEGKENYIEMPELVELAKRINEGKYPQIVEKFRNPAVLGQFRSTKESGNIFLKADTFIGPEIDTRLTRAGKSAELMVAKLKEQYGEDGYKYKVKTVGNKSLIQVFEIDPTYAAKIIGHEIGHMDDWLPDKDLSRGNIFGRIKTLKKYFKQSIEEQDLGTIKRDDVMNELKNLSQRWKPFDVKANPRYTNYRYSSAELYADAASVFFNDPKILQDMAPTFYKLYTRYMDKKPEFKRVYEEIQQRSRNPEALSNNRLETITNNYKVHEEKRKELREAIQEKAEGVVDTFLKTFIDKNNDILKYIRVGEKQGGEIANIARNARYELEEMAYISSRINEYYYNFTKKVLEPLNDIDVDLLGAYLQANRVVVGDRSTYANPEGHNVKTSTELINSIYRKLGEEKFSNLVKAANNFYDMRQVVITEIENSGLYRPDLIQFMKDNREYATISITKYMDNLYGGNTTSRIYRQIGTLQSEGNPLINTILKDISMLRAAAMNEAKTATVLALKEISPESAIDAKTEYNPSLRKRTPLKPNDVRKDILSIMVDGEPQHFYVSKAVKEIFDYRPYEAKAAIEIMLKMSSLFKNVVVSKNPGWMIFNLPKDFMSTFTNNPEVKVRDIPKLIGMYRKAGKEAWKEVFKKERSETLSQMYKTKALTSNRIYKAQDYDYETELDKQLAEVLGDINNKIAGQEKEAKSILKRVGNSLEGLGKVSELSGKIAGYKYLKEKTNMTDAELAHRTRGRVGTPDFKRKGTGQLFTNNVWMFSNVNKEGWRAAYESYKSDPGAYIFKTFVTDILPKLVMIGAGAGLLGEKYKELIDGATEYDKSHYTIIPFYKKENGKVVYARIPTGYIGQFFGGLVWKIANGDILGQKGIVKFAAEQSPYNLDPDNPIYNIAKDLTEFYLLGINPKDEYRGRNIMPDWLFKAGGTEANKALWKNIWQEAGGSMLLDLSIFYSDDEFDKALKVFPLNILGRFIKVTDYGYMEE